MPVPRNPRRAEFYVYRLCVESVPFYVGIGRDRRASDRVRYVKYLMARNADGKPVKWHFSASVIAALLTRGHKVVVRYAVKNLTRVEALRRESVQIHNLRRRGLVLANSQQNPDRPKHVRTLVRLIEKRLACAA